MGGNGHSPLGMDPVNDVLEGKTLWEVSWVAGESKDEEMAFCTMILQASNKEKLQPAGD